MKGYTYIMISIMIPLWQIKALVNGNVYIYLVKENIQNVKHIFEQLTKEVTYKF